MIGVYFSGTGNTKYCTEKFLSYYDSSVEMFSLESTVVGNQILQHDMILLAYPIYYSQMPKIVKDFIINNRQIWKNKKYL